MGMNYAQIRPLMKNGEWQTPQGNLYVFFSNNPIGMYSFLIDPKIGLAGIEINMVGITLAEVVRRLTRSYGSPGTSSNNSYVWGMDGNLPDNIFAISVNVSSEAAAFIEIRIMFNNSLSLIQ